MATSHGGQPPRRASWSWVLLLVPMLLLTPIRGLAFQNEPTGFEKARFGMTVDEVTKIFPQAKQYGNPTPEAAALMAVYTLEKQKVLGLKSCTVTFYFDPARLYQIGFDCGHGVEVPAALQKRFGAPMQATTNSALWQAEKTAVSLNTKSRQFQFMDRELTGGFQARLMKYVLMHQPGQATPTPAAPAPAATPQ
jgi:hypothetical protein